MPNFTKNAIKASFLKLLNERPLNKITIKDIVTDCGINRNSFYYHYQDIPALLEEIIREESDRIIKQYPTISSFEECLKISVEFALQNKKAVFHIYNSLNRDIFERYLWEACRYVVTTYISTAFGVYNVSETDRDIIIKYYKCEIFGQVSEWLDSGMKEDILAVNNRLCELRKGMVEELFKRSEESNTQAN
ncbi:MAG: TetR/AcrR family transcriptional regulator [Clostridia bacterium]|nr:TetR/AcrR family transcriptional regulator [Clostridia bacterium]